MQAGASFDLILLDILMPGMDGVETARALRKHTLAPILFLTARTRLDDRMAAYRCGGDDFLPKPFSKVELILKVDALLRRYRVYQGKKEQPPEAGHPAGRKQPLRHSEWAAGGADRKGI